MSPSFEALLASEDDGDVEIYRTEIWVRSDDPYCWGVISVTPERLRAWANLIERQS